MGAKILGYDDGDAILDTRCEDCPYLYYDELDWKFPMCKKNKCPLDAAENTVLTSKKERKMEKQEREFKIAELLEEAKEYENLKRFYESLPSVKSRLKTEESHLPLIYITSIDKQKKVIKGLECCITNTPECLFKNNPCPYVTECMKNDVKGTTALMRDALALLKEQEEQIKNRDESLEKAREEIKWLRKMLKENGLV